MNPPARVMSRTKLDDSEVEMKAPATPQRMPV